MTTGLDLDAVLDRVTPAIAERAAKADATDAFVAGSYDALRRERVFSAQVPAELGGGGCAHAAMADFLRRLAHACPSTALALSMHQHLVAAAVLNHRAGRPGKALLERVGRDEAILVSTGANDWLESNGRAEPIEGGWRVSAVKPFASGSPMGDVLVTSAVEADGPDGPRVLHFPVPLDADGVTVGDDWRAMGMRATGSNTVTLDRVFVPEGALALARPRGPFHPAFAVILTVALPLIMAAYLGTAEAAARIAVERARRRGDDPVTAMTVGRMETALTTARLACEDMVRRAADPGFTPDAEAAAAALTRKAIAAEAVRETVETALEATGGAGFFRATGLERLLRDIHGAGFHPLPAGRQQLFCGRLALGLAPVAAPAEGPAARHAA